MGNTCILIVTVYFGMDGERIEVDYLAG